MSNDTQRADQIEHNLYVKLSLVVNDARATTVPHTTKLNKWVSVLSLAHTPSLWD